MDIIRWKNISIGDRFGRYTHPTSLPPPSTPTRNRLYWESYPLPFHPLPTRMTIISIITIIILTIILLPLLLLHLLPRILLLRLLPQLPPSIRSTPRYHRTTPVHPLYPRTSIWILIWRARLLGYWGRYPLLSPPSSTSWIISRPLWIVWLLCGGSYDWYSTFNSTTPPLSYSYYYRPDKYCYHMEYSYYAYPCCISIPYVTYPYLYLYPSKSLSISKLLLSFFCK